MTQDEATDHIHKQATAVASHALYTAITHCPHRIDTDKFVSLVITKLQEQHETKTRQFLKGHRAQRS